MKSKGWNYEQSKRLLWPFSMQPVNPRKQQKKLELITAIRSILLLWNFLSPDSKN